MTAGPVLILAGGTGVHIFPGLAVAQALRGRDVPVAWLGAQGAMETKLVPLTSLPDSLRHAQADPHQTRAAAG